ncbi:hypothetical protein [Polynucleobacter sp. Tro8-14-1]|jgi:hypothetical protein|uniref:hypothetical protein n=1 Tax=Polynucleobacter sp. Tro8-14-1 TaxID=1758383 RepID=UPI001C0DB253|nr:hypothetical protein [Polynucleobacter sp. Tro8-14-1]MBU3563654.1 hypothetical protein [Polynucleobacter sp. Tro8-14-1]
MKKSSLKIKSFHRFMTEEKEKFYTCDLFPNMTKEDVVYLLNELLPLTLKMLKNGQVLITVEPVLDGEEE